MKTEVLLRSIGKINDELIADAESEANTKRKPGWAKPGIMAACLALVLAVALVIPTLTQQDQSIITENEPGVKLTLEEAMDDKTFGTLFPRKILEGYVLEDAPSIWGITDYAELKTADNAVLKANFYNEELEDEMVIRIASKEWFLSHEKNSIELNTIYYRETIDKAGSYIYFESGDEIISYSFSTRDIAQIDGFCDMVNSASADTSSVSVSKFISLEEAKKIALKDAKLDELTQKIVFTREELSRNQGKPFYLLEFYTGTNQYFYQIDAKSGSIIYAGKFITLSEAKKIALDDAGCKDKVSFTEETLVSGGIKTPYYRLVFADAKTQWTYRIDAVLGTVLEKQQKEIVTTDFISLEEAKEIALKDAGLNESTQKIVFTREELNRNSGKPCYILEFYTAKKQYSYKVDAKNGSIMEAYHFILLADAKKIALDDAGVNVKVVFTTEELVAGGIKTPYYRFVFADAKTQWTYRIDAVLGTVLEKQQKEIVTTDFISLEEAKQIALKDAGLDEAAQKIVFTREELSRNQGKPCYILEFYTAKKQYSYKVDAKNGSIMEAYHFILLADAKKIALDDAGVSEKVTFTEETLVAGGIKSPYYYFAFESASARWTYKIDAVLGVIMDKTCDKIIPPAPEFIGLEKAKQIALEDAGLDEATQKIVFTREELSRNSGKPCYILEFYTAKKQYSYKVDAKDGSIMEAYHFILLADAKKIALDDAGVSEKVIFTEETLVAGGIKSPYYYFAFESDSARWTYKIDAVLGVIMDKTCDKIIPPAPEFIGLEKAKQIALEDAGLDETAQKIVFTREELSRNSGKPCYILEFYTDKCAYSYKVDAVSGEIIGKKTEWFSRQESETVPDTSQNSDSKHR